MVYQPMQDKPPFPFGSPAFGGSAFKPPKDYVSQEDKIIAEARTFARKYRGDHPTSAFGSPYNKPGK